MDLRRIVNAVLRKWWLIILTSLIGGLAGFFLVYSSPAVYSGVVTMYAMDLTAIQEEGERLDYYDIELSRQVIAQFREALFSQRVTSVVVSQLSGYSLSEEDLLKMVSIDSNVDDNIFYIYAENTDPTIASRVANAMAAQFAVIIRELVNTDIVGILDQASIPEEPESKNLVAMIFSGLIAGFAVGFMAIYISEYFDPRIYGKRDLYKRFGNGFLGSVPKYISTEGEVKQ